LKWYGREEWSEETTENTFSMFKPIEFERFRKRAGLNSFVLTPILEPE